MGRQRPASMASVILPKGRLRNYGPEARSVQLGLKGTLAEAEWLRGLAQASRLSLGGLLRRLVGLDGEGGEPGSIGPGRGEGGLHYQLERKRRRRSGGG